jgi:ABC-type transporter MlaC component
MRRIIRRPRSSGRARLVAGRVPPVAAIVIALFLALLPRTLLAGTAAAEQHVAEAMSVMTEIARAVKEGKGGQDAAFRRLLAKDFDASTLAMASLPEEVSESADAASLAKYRSAFVVYLTKAFLEEAARAPLYETRVAGSRNHATGRIIVHTVGEAPNGNRREGDWFVTPGAAPRIVDAAIRGILLSANERKRFARVLARGGMSGLVAALEKGPSGFTGSPGEDVWR